MPAHLPGPRHCLPCGFSPRRLRTAASREWAPLNREPRRHLAQRGLQLAAAVGLADAVYIDVRSLPQHLFRVSRVYCANDRIHSPTGCCGSKPRYGTVRRGNSRIANGSAVHPRIAPPAHGNDTGDALWLRRTPARDRTEKARQAQQRAEASENGRRVRGATRRLGDNGLPADDTSDTVVSPRAWRWSAPVGRRRGGSNREGRPWRGGARTALST